MHAMLPHIMVCSIEPCLRQDLTNHGALTCRCVFVRGAQSKGFGLGAVALLGASPLSACLGACGDQQSRSSGTDVLDEPNGGIQRQWHGCTVIASQLGNTSRRLKRQIVCLAKRQLSQHRAAQTVHQNRKGSIETDSGALLLMYEDPRLPVSLVPACVLCCRVRRCWQLSLSALQSVCSVGVPTGLRSL